MRDVIGDIDRPLERPLRYLIPHPATWKDYSCCPWAKTVIAIDPENDNLVCCPVTCKRWGCSYCAQRKIRKLAYLTNQAMPNRWIRLGVDPALHESPQAAWEKTSPLFPECMRLLRKILGCELEYLRVTEIHDGKKKPEDPSVRDKNGTFRKSALGYPHYHALLRSGFIPKKLMDDTWARLTGAPYNWIAKINQTFSSFRYMTKYLTKLHKIEWTDRHVSYSKNFFPEEAREKMAFPERSIIERSEEHPWLYLSRRYDRDTVGVDANGCYHLNQEFCGTPRDMSRADVGLPFLPEKTEPPPPKRVQMKAFDNTSEPDYTSASF